MRTLLIVSLAFTLAANAATVVWTNTSGGAWSTAANWSPNQVPGPGDSAFITNDGTYTVTISTDASVAGITLGGGTGTQTVSLASATLNLNGALTINPQGTFQWNGGTISGVATLTGALDWKAGDLRESDFTVASNGVLSLSGAGTKTLLHSTVNNAGTMS